MIQRLSALVCIIALVFAAQAAPVRSAASIQILPVGTLGHGRFQDMAWSPVTDRLAIGSTMGVWLYDGKNLDAPRLLGSDWTAHRVLFSPDGALIAAYNAIARELMAWQVATGEKRLEVRLPTEIHGVALSPDHKMLFALSEKALYLLDTSSGTLRRTLTVDSEMLSPLAISHDGTLFALSNAQGKVELWSVAGRKRLVTFPAAGGRAVRDILFAPDDKHLFVVRFDGAMEVWRGAGSTWARDERPQPTQRITCLAMSPNGRLMATWNYGGPVQVWSVDEGLLSPAGSLAWPQLLPSNPSRLAFNPDGTQLAGQDGNGNVLIWDIRSGQLRATLASDAKSGIAFNPVPGDIRFALSRANQVELWTTSGGQMALRRTLASPDQRVGGLAFNPDGKTIFAGSVAMVDIPNYGKRARGVVYRWDTETGQLLGSWLAEKPDNPEGHPSSLHIRPDGRVLAFAFTLDSMSCLRLNSYVAFWDIAAGKMFDLLVSYRGTLDAVFSPDGSLLAVNELKDTCVAMASSIQIAEVGTKATRATLTLDKPAFSFAFSPDGKRFAAVTWDTVNVAANRESAVILWDTSTFQKQATYSIKRSQVGKMAFSPNGRFVALGDGDGRLYLLDAANGEPAASIQAHPAYLQDVVFSPDGSLLATIGAEGSVRFWRIIEGENT